MAPIIFEKQIPVALVKANNLPSLPTVALEVLRLCDDERSTLDDLAQAVQKDPALAAKMLKLSNSSMFSLGQEVTTLKHASMVLGMKTVKLMSLSFSLAQSLPKNGASGFDYNAYWWRSLIAAVTARTLAHRAGKAFMDEAFLAGLLSHLGQLTMAECLSELYVEVLDAAAPAWPTAEFEEERLGFNHSDVAGTLLSKWNLPELIWCPVAYMFRPQDLGEEASKETRELVEIMAFAAHTVGLFTSDDNGGHLEALESLAHSQFSMNGYHLEAFLVGLEGKVKEAAEMLSIDLSAEEPFPELLLRARGRMVQLSLSASADLEAVEQRAADLETTTDELTGLPNREAFDDRLAEEISLRIESPQPRALGLIMIDVDRFKVFNDRHGHQAGDAVIQMVGRVLSETTRSADFSARYGGEEFVVMLPQTTPTFLRMVANRVREAIEAEVVNYDSQQLRVTASMGGACISSATSKKDGRILIMLADKLLNRAKENGRNRVEVYHQTKLPSSPTGDA